ncbi:protein phosphatase [Synechococcus sp. CS-1324]|uniref:protein phosphatase n=1 Tax=Synechococcus sp. CS-1324 TaxID=2847980 RepID=UPI00223AD8C4|nr:protein phosphatase [Synechococcus sp. CS-1324]MCT0230697.1 protein phosphatase [Synechococcus sp. CS-1324]
MSAPPAAADPAVLQAALFEFAIGELVRQHRSSFPPLWTAESWAKLMIWLALSCGCSGDDEGLRRFAAALEPALARRLRQTFFERTLEDLELRLLADPADSQVVVLPLHPSVTLPPERVAEALARVGLSERVVDPADWQQLEGLVAVPWAQASEAAHS